MTGSRDETSRSTPPARYGYFVLQANAVATGGSPELRGVMEDLSTGEKREFSSAAEVARVMDTWASSGSVSAPRLDANETER
jgi:hypothetical protein